jgi:hypothetical protein
MAASRAIFIFPVLGPERISRQVVLERVFSMRRIIAHLAQRVLLCGVVGGEEMPNGGFIQKNVTF